jgi:hypothetical protein
VVGDSVLSDYAEAIEVGGEDDEEREGGGGQDEGGGERATGVGSDGGSTLSEKNKNVGAISYMKASETIGALKREVHTYYFFIFF